MLLFETILTTVGVLYFWVVFRTSRPPSPPSLAATRRKQSITQGMWKDTKILFANRNFMLVLFVFSLVYSIYAGIGFVINPLLGPLGYTTTEIALIAMFIVLLGTISAMLTGIILDRTNKYKLTLRVVCFASFITILSSAYFLSIMGDNSRSQLNRGGTIGGAVVFCIMSGISIVPIIPVCFSLATECTHPVQPALVTGLLMSCA